MGKLKGDSRFIGCLPFNVTQTVLAGGVCARACVRVSVCVCAQLTFNYLLGRGVVDLLLGGVGGEHAVKGVRLALKSTTQRSQLAAQTA